MFASRVACGRSGVFTCDVCKGTIIGSADLVQHLVGRVDDVGPKGKVLGQGKFHFGLTYRKVKLLGDFGGQGRLFAPDMTSALSIYTLVVTTPPGVSETNN